MNNLSPILTPFLFPDSMIKGHPVNATYCNVVLWSCVHVSCEVEILHYVPPYKFFINCYNHYRAGNLDIGGNLNIR